MKTADLVAVMMALDAEKQMKAMQEKTQAMQREADFSSELAKQAETKTQKINESVSQNPNELRAKNNKSGGGSSLSRLNTAKAVIGTPEGDMGTNGDLGTYFKKELVK